jgi:microcystin degradation protein MlrC
VGPGVPIVATLDLHANVSERMVAAADILVGYDTYPHVDMAERGREATRLLARLIAGKLRPFPALVKPPMLPTSQRMTTDRDPMRRLIALAHDMEARPGVLNVTVAGGFPPADVPEAGASVLVTTDDDPELARSLANELARVMWLHRDEFLGGVESIDTAAAAIGARASSSAPPIVIVDIGDNPWTGGPGDSAYLLGFLLKCDFDRAALALIRDPESVRRCIEAGVGNRVTLELGGKTDGLHGPPLPVDGRVRLLSDGRYVNSGPMMAGVVVDLGPTAVVDVAGISVLVTTRAETPIDLNVFRRHGIEPARLRVIGLKGKGHFRAAFEPIASRVILVEGPGITGADLTRLPFRHIRRPIWPLDPDVEWQP